ncbi:26482_t:CDS:2, partial [Dentiscutata erythropus]
YGEKTKNEEAKRLLKQEERKKESSLMVAKFIVGINEIDDIGDLDKKNDELR